jgi:hypothetical protein
MKVTQNMISVMAFYSDDVISSNSYSSLLDIVIICFVVEILFIFKPPYIQSSMKKLFTKYKYVK